MLRNSRSALLENRHAMSLPSWVLSMSCITGGCAGQVKRQTGEKCYKKWLFLHFVRSSTMKYLYPALASTCSHVDGSVHLRKSENLHEFSSKCLLLSLQIFRGSFSRLELLTFSLQFHSLSCLLTKVHAGPANWPHPGVPCKQLTEQQFSQRMELSFQLAGERRFYV